MPRMTPSAFDPARYPRTYTASAGWRAFAWLVGGALAIGAAWGMSEAVQAPPSPRLVDRLWLALLLAGLLGLGIALVASTVRGRVVLAAGFIEARGLRTWRLRREDIVDYRVHVHNGIREFRLRGRSRRRPFTFTQVFTADEAFAAWFAGLVDSDARGHEDELRRIVSDDTLGATPLLRLDRAERARRTTRWLLVACYGVALWMMMRRDPGAAVIVLTASLPVVALALAWRFGGLFTLATSRRPARADLGALLILPACALAVRAMIDAPLAQPSSLVVPALAAGGVLALLALAIDGDLRAARLQAAGMTLVLVLYAAGLLAVADVRLDRGAPGRTVATVAAKRHTSGKGASARLALAGQPEERSVSEDLYRRVAVGDRVCLLDHPGAFGWRWTRIDDASACAAP